MTRDVLIGNLLSAGAMVSESISGTRQKQKDILAIQIVSQFFYGTSAFFLKGYSAIAQNIVAIFRNLLAMRDVRNKAVEGILVVMGVVLGAVINNRGLLGWLPIIANLEYTLAIFRFKDNERALKSAFIVNSLMFVVFNFVIDNYVGTVTNTVIAITTAVSLIRGHRNKNKESQEE